MVRLISLLAFLLFVSACDFKKKSNAFWLKKKNNKVFDSTSVNVERSYVGDTIFLKYVTTDFKDEFLIIDDENSCIRRLGEKSYQDLEFISDTFWSGRYLIKKFVLNNKSAYDDAIYYYYSDSLDIFLITSEFRQTEWLLIKNDSFIDNLVKEIYVSNW